MLILIAELRKDRIRFEPFRSLVSICIDRIAAPAVIRQTFDNVCPQGITVNIAGQKEHRGVIFNNDAFESPLKQVP